MNELEEAIRRLQSLVEGQRHRMTALQMNVDQLNREATLLNESSSQSHSACTEELAVSAALFKEIEEAICSVGP